MSSIMEVEDILKILPHRYPFILVDKVISIELGKEITAIKNVTVNEPYFPGHFPYHPVMPGVLIVEALAQAAALLSFKTMDAKPTEDSVYYFAGIDRPEKSPKETENLLSLVKIFSQGNISNHST